MFPSKISPILSKQTAPCGRLLGACGADPWLGERAAVHRGVNGVGGRLRAARDLRHLWRHRAHRALDDTSSSLSRTEANRGQIKTPLLEHTRSDVPIII